MLENLIIVFIYKPEKWCAGRDLNPHVRKDI